MRIEDQLVNLIKKGIVQVSKEGKGAKLALQEELAKEFLAFIKFKRLLRGKRNDERLILAEKVASDLVNKKAFCREVDGKWQTVFQGGKKK
jgi:hypothetical protein